MTPRSIGASIAIRLLSVVAVCGTGVGLLARPVDALTAVQKPTASIRIITGDNAAGLAVSVTAIVHNGTACTFSSIPAIAGLDRRVGCARGIASDEGAMPPNMTHTPRRFVISVVVVGRGGRLTRTEAIVQGSSEVSPSTTTTSTVSTTPTVPTTSASSTGGFSAGGPAPSGLPSVLLGPVSTSMSQTDGTGGGPGGDAELQFTVDPDGLSTDDYVVLSVDGLVVNQSVSAVAPSTSAAATGTVSYTGLPLASQYTYTVWASNNAGSASASGSFMTAEPATDCSATSSGSSESGPPLQVCWASGLSYPSYGNDYWSDCTFAAAAYLQQTWSNEVGAGSGALDPNTVLSEYQSLTGATPANPNVGVSTSQLLSQWSGAGIDGSQIDASAQLAGITNQTSMELAIWRLGGVYVTAGNLPASDESLPIGTPWTVANSTGSSEGGHALAAIGYDSTYVYVVTWGRVQAVTWGWWDAYVSQVVAALPDVFVKADQAPTESLQALEAQYFGGNQ